MLEVNNEQDFLEKCLSDDEYLYNNVSVIKNILKLENEFVFIDKIIPKLLNIYTFKNKKSLFNDTFEALKSIVWARRS